MDSHLDRKCAAVEGKDASFRRDGDTDGGSDDERLIKSAGTAHALQRLHGFANPDRHAVECEFCPGAQWPRGERAVAPRRVGNVVIGLLDGGTREVWLGGLRVGRHHELEDRVRGYCLTAFRYRIALLPWITRRALKPRLCQTHFGRQSRNVNAHLKFFAGG